MQPEWAGVGDDLMPGTEVLVKVAATRQPGLYRWPLQLELLEPSAAAARIVAPSEWRCPANLGWAFDQGWTLQEVAARLGRRYVSARHYLEQDHSLDADATQHAYGWDEDDIDGDPLDPMARGVLDAATRAAIEAMAAGGGGDDDGGY